MEVSFVIIFILFIISLMILYVWSQSRNMPFNLNLYIKRLWLLLTLIGTYLKNLGHDVVAEYRKIDWSLDSVQN